MILKNSFRLASLASLLLVGCGQNELFVPPVVELPNVTPISKSTLKGMEGVYKLSSGGEGLGTEWVCKVSRNRVSFFSNSRGIFMILKVGMNPADSSIKFAGFWRVSENTTNGTVNFNMAKDQGARNILKGLGTAGLAMTGTFTDGSQQTIAIQYNRDFSAKVKSKPIVIFGHHGIQTTANPPFTENSLECVRQAEDYGANGIELDVRLTKDNVPVLFHDPDISTRITRKSGIVGDLSKVPYSALFDFVRLIDGQRIPKVEEVLAVAIDESDLEYVWLDVKGNPDVFKYMEPIVRAAIAHAQASGRNIEIITDIPTQTVLEEYLKQPSYAGLPIMYETGLDKAIEINAKYWGPRWTMGTLNSEVEKAHGAGMKVFSWTLNAQAFIKSYLDNGNFDGFITDYPCYVVYNYYTR